VGPTLVATHFTPFVLKSKEKIFVNFSSNLSSVTIAWSDMRLSYSMAKAAVNMLVRDFPFQSSAISGILSSML